MKAQKCKTLGTMDSLQRIAMLRSAPIG